MKKKQGAPIGSANAKKEVKADSILHIRCKTSDKAQWVAMAMDKGGLSAWVIKTLNNASKNAFKNPAD